MGMIRTRVADSGRVLDPRACQAAVEAAVKCAGMECMKCIEAAFHEVEKNSVGLPRCEELAELCEAFKPCVCDSKCDALEAKASEACVTISVKAEYEACPELCEADEPDTFLRSS